MAIPDTYAHQRDDQGKKPWDWTLEERIALRSDRGAAKQRIASARARNLAPKVTTNGALSDAPITDIIDGKESPHLFLPMELFESVVRHGFVFEGWREAYIDRIDKSGLPANFWDQLEQVAALYIADLREQARLEQMRDRDEAHKLLRILEPQLCRDRADALRKARAVLGPALDVLMYRHVAPMKTITFTHVESPAVLRLRDRGCR